MTNGQPTEPELFLTKTEVFVVDCRKRGMSGTAIRRLLQLSAAEAVALGIIPAQAGRSQAARKADAEQPTAEAWPQKEGRRKVFPRRRGRRHPDPVRQAVPRPQEFSEAQRCNPNRTFHKQSRPARGESV